MIKKLPLIELCINPENNSFVSAISLVNSPAVESSFLAFSSDKMNKEPFQKFTFSNERRELIGIAMKADTPIYRNDADGEYVVTFSKETVRQIAQTYFKMKFTTATNIEHSKEDAESVIFQSYIVDDERGIPAPKGITDAKDGDWIVGMKVNSESVWNDIKSGKQTGFSVEGIFNFIKTEKLIDFQFNKLKPSQVILDFYKELEVELDAIINKFNLKNS